MYLLSLAFAGTAYAVSRGPDGALLGFILGFGVLGLIYLGLAWITRHQPIWPHIAIHPLLFCAVIAFAMAPRPHLDEMAGMLYLLAPLAVGVMTVLAVLIRLAGRWF